MSVIDAAGAIRANSVPGQYPVNLRLTVPFLPRPFFVTFIVGRERRGSDRLKEERTRHPVSTWGNLFALVSFWSVLNVAILFAALVATRI
jgi:hypothetical protein